MGVLDGMGKIPGAILKVFDDAYSEGYLIYLLIGIIIIFFLLIFFNQSALAPVPTP